MHAVVLMSRRRFEALKRNTRDNYCYRDCVMWHAEADLREIISVETWNVMYHEGATFYRLTVFPRDTRIVLSEIYEGIKIVKLNIFTIVDCNVTIKNE